MTESSLFVIGTPPGKRVQVRRGSHDRFWKGFELSDWEPETTAVFTRFTDSSHSYIDIGAWIGPTVLLGCQLAKNVYAIEPDPIAFAELSENIEANRPLTDRVRLFNICITAVSGKVGFGNRGSGGDSESSLLFSTGPTSWTVDGVNFQEWVDQQAIRDCTFIKMDIEGGEYTVLPTMVAYLKENRPTLYLSLHPCFLGDLKARGVAKLTRALSRLGSTIRLLNKVRFYKHVYDAGGLHEGHKNRHRIVGILTRAKWNPAVLFLICLRGLFGRPNAVVFTDERL